MKAHCEDGRIKNASPGPSQVLTMGVNISVRFWMAIWERRTKQKHLEAMHALDLAISPHYFI